MREKPGGGLLRWGPHLCSPAALSSHGAHLSSASCSPGPEREGWRTLQQRPLLRGRSSRSQEIEELERFIDSYVLEYQVQGLLTDKTEGDESEKTQSTSPR